jgi:type III pantothenate kinase
LIAVDIGNSRIKFGRFAVSAFGAADLPEPTATLDLDTDTPDHAALGAWLADSPRDFRWCIGSVNRPATTRLTEWLKSNSGTTAATILTAADLPLIVRLEQPERVGIDRLLGAVAANRLRHADRAAIVIDLGTAITIDLVDAQGAFRGGAILPGIGMAARAMHEQTDQLPRIPMSELDAPPPALGRSTLAAIESGLFWGTIGAAKELISRLTVEQDVPCDIFLTGGAAASVARLVDPQAQHVPHLVLGGIAIVAATNCTSSPQPPASSLSQ